MSKLEKMKKILERDKKKLRQNYGVIYIGIFGSYVTGKQRKGSDIDILVEFEEPPDLFKFLELENKLSEILGGKVDLVMRDALKPIIGKKILQEVVSL